MGGLPRLSEQRAQLHTRMHACTTCTLMPWLRSQAMSWLLSVPGASATVLEASVPYARDSLVSVLGKVRWHGAGGAASHRHAA